MEQLIQFVMAHPVLVGLFVFFLIALIVTESRRGGQSISSAQLTQLINHSNGVIFDIRDPAEFKAGHITGAVNVPYTSLKDRLKDLAQHQSKPVVLVCKMGQFSGAAGRLLRENGFKDVRRLSGGIGAWSADNLPLVKG